MRTKREAKKILKAFGREEGKARIKYVESFLPEKTSFIGAISYRHTFRRIGIIVLLSILILALTISAYAAIMHYLNYTKTVHPDNDEYVPTINNSNQNGIFDDIEFYEPKYIPDGYVLYSEEYDEDFQEREWHYENENGDALVIRQGPVGRDFHINNENCIQTIDNVSEIEVVIYENDNETTGVFQYEKTLIMVSGRINNNELKEIVKDIIK